MVPVVALGLLMPTFALAQAKSDESDKKVGDVVELSPFIVNAEQDNGYRAASTLAGSRLSTELKDVGAAVSVYTREFLDDIGVSKIEDILSYTMSTEGGGMNGNYSGITGPTGTTNSSADSSEARDNPSGVNRVRGLVTADRTRDFFASDFPTDGYNTDTVTVNRGPNAILAGLGSAGGIIDSAMRKAIFKDNYRAVLKLSDYGTHREELHVNKVLLPKKLAIRFDLLNEHQVFRQTPAYSDDQRLYTALNYRVWNPAQNKGSIVGQGTFRANFETGKIEGVPPNPLGPLSTMDAWFGYADPSLNKWYVDGSAPYSASTAAPKIYKADGTLFTTPAAATAALGGNFQGFPLFRQWTLVYADPSSGQAGVGFVDPTLAAIQGFQGQIVPNIPTGPGGQLRGTGDRERGVLGYYRTQLQDRNIFDYFNYLLTGSLDYRKQNFNAGDYRFEQLLFGGKAGFELAYNKQSFTRKRNFPISGGEEEIYIDVNKYLSVRDGSNNKILNPNFGRPFINSSDVFRDQLNRTTRESYQMTTFFRHDFGRSDSEWLQMLGRHTLSTLFFKTNIDSSNRTYHSTWDPTGQLNPATSTGVGPGLFASQVNGWFYIGDSLASANSLDEAKIYPITAQLPQYGQSYTLRIYDPISKQFVTGTSTPLRILSKAVDQTQDVGSTAISLQSSFLKGRLNTVVGWREDRSDNFTGLTPPTLPNGGLDETQITLVPSVSEVTRTWTKSVVGVLPFKLPLDTELRVFWNDSGNFDPVGQRRNIWNEELGSPKGKTREYGVMLTALNGKVDFRINRFRTAISDQTIGSYNPYGYISTMITRIITARDSSVDITDPTWGYTNFSDWNAVADAFYRSIPARLRIGDAYNFNPHFTDSSPTKQWVVDSIVGLASTSDTVSTGTEFEATLNPTRSWRISLNYTQNEAVKADVAAQELAFAASWKEGLAREGINIVTAHRSPGAAVGTDPTFWGQYTNETLAGIRAAAAASGTPSSEIRKWRMNLVTRYKFLRGALKGFEVGGALRMQAKPIIGFPLITVTGVGKVYDLTAPYYGPSDLKVDLSAGYTRNIRFAGNAIKWNIGLNVRNLNAKDEIVPIAANADGTLGVFRVPPERTWSVTNSFSF